MRRQRDTSPNATTDRAAMRRLADRYPGCLRELDVLGIAELERRAHVLAAGADEPWMAWIAAYHAVARAALALKRVVGRTPPEDPKLRASLAQLASETAQVSLAPGFVDEVARPPGGRMQPTLLRHTATAFGIEPQRLAEALFPTRRPSPYSAGP